MDPFTKSRTEAENKAFKEVPVEVDLDSSDWFEHLTKRFPNKTPQQLTNRYVDHIGRKFKQLPNTVHMQPTKVTMAAGMEDLSVTGLHYSQDFPGIGSTCSRIESTSVTGKKPEEKDPVLSTEKGAKEAVFSEEIARQGSFNPIDERLMEESSNEQMLKQATEVEEELQIWLEKITNGDDVLTLQTEEMETVKVLSQGTQGMEIEEPEVVTQIRGGKNVLKDVATVTVGKRRMEEPGTFTTRKKNIWSEEEHRLFLMGLKVHGKGAWKSIAKNFVNTRTPSQVASHAQKYFNRQLDERQKRRPSILDIKTINTTAKTCRVSTYDSINSSSQVNLNNAKQFSPSSMPLPPLPQMEFIQMVSNERPLHQKTQTPPKQFPNFRNQTVWNNNNQH